MSNGSTEPADPPLLWDDLVEYVAGLMVDDATTAVANEAATTGTAGRLHTQAVGGYPYCYLGFTADNATPQAVTISAVPRV